MKTLHSCLDRLKTRFSWLLPEQRMCFNILSYLFPSVLTHIVIRQFIIELCPLNPIQSVSSKASVQHTVCQQEASHVRYNVENLNEDIEKNSCAHLLRGIDFVIEIILNDRVCFIALERRNR